MTNVTAYGDSAPPVEAMITATYGSVMSAAR
jgi:hypothetical protein